MSFDSKLFAFLSLLVVQVVVSVIYKFSQTKGKYTYSPLSAIASAEFIKLCMLKGWLVTSIDIQNQIDVYSKAEEEIEFE